ncbi:MAG: DUF6320 domain-containing protein [Clostridiales bacterium]|nr:DUF6320 domain-containing protein [Clostridiales bacterium]
MEQKIDCAVIRDLLPNYIEQLTSEKTNEIMEEHFNTCTECRNERDNLMSELHMDKIPEHKEFKKYLNKTKIVYFCKGGLLAIGMITVLVSFIVDLAVNHRLSWSLFVDLSIGYIAACTATAIFTKKSRILKTMGVGSILLIPLLYGFQGIMNLNYIFNKVYWFQDYGFPILLICLVVIWCPILVMKLLKLKKEEV